MSKNQITFHIGNVLILGAFLLLFYTYYPIISLYLSPHQNLSILSSGFYIDIPKINAQAPVLENIDPWNKNEYQKALKHGIAHAKGTSLPNQPGRIFLFAHSSDVPWRITRYNTIFFRLGELKIGDEITLIKEGKKFKYNVYDKKEVWPNEVGYLKNDYETDLVLQTCTPVGTDLKRLLVFAKPV